MDTPQIIHAKLMCCAEGWKAYTPIQVNVLIAKYCYDKTKIQGYFMNYYKP